MADETPKETITAITVKGFKSLYDETRIELRPLTILAGANSSGKSSAIQPLLLLKQTLEDDAPIPLQIYGDSIRFEHSNQFISRISGKPEITQFSVGFETGEKNTFTFKQGEKGAIEDVVQTLESPSLKSGSVTLYRGMNQDEILRVFESAGITLPDEQKRWHWRIIRLKFIHHLYGTESERGGYAIEPLEDKGQYAIEAWLRYLIHVSAKREEVEEKQETTTVEPPFPGRFHQYVSSIVLHWQESNDPRLSELIRQLQWLGLTWTIHAERRKDSASEIEVKVGRTASQNGGSGEDLVNIFNVGIGVSHLLPVLVALLAAERGNTVYVEHPEMHLHPAAQWRFGELLGDAIVKRGIRVIVETHSHLWLLGIQAFVADKGQKDFAKLHWFTRLEDGRSRVDSGDLDEKGRFGDWPEDFGKVELLAASRFIVASTKHGWK